MTGLPEAVGAPEALVLADPADVPERWRDELATLVRPTWWPAGLAELPPGDSRLEAARVLVTTPQALDAAALSRLPRLRLVVATTTAVDYIDVAHCAARGIAVRGAGRYAGTSVAEHAFALLLASVRRLGAAAAAARGEGEPPDLSCAFELAGRTAGVVGPGDIGRRVAGLAAGFGMRVAFTGRRPQQLAGAVQLRLDDLLAAADAVFLCVPLTPATRHLLDRRRLALLKPTAHLVSISPDEVVDLVALRAALAGGALGGAALDLVGDARPYRDVPRLVLTRRWGIRTAEARERRARHWVTAVREGVAAGLDPARPTEPPPGPRRPTVFAAAEERVTEFAEQGYTVVPDALSAAQVERLTLAMDRALDRYPDRVRAEPAKRRSQLYGIPALDPALVEPLMLPTTMPVVCTFLGWNIHLHHSHLDLTRPLPTGEGSSYRWHRDMQSTTYTLPPPLPLLSVKVGYFLTGCPTPESGSVMVIPGSHRTDRVERPGDFGQDQPAAVPVLAPAGSALVLDARTWHTVGKNVSAVPRRMLYYAYTYRWIRPSEEVDLPPEQLAALTPVERQLLGASTSAQGYHFPRDEDVPLRPLVQAAAIRSFTLEAELTA